MYGAALQQLKPRRSELLSQVILPLVQRQLRKQRRVALRSIQCGGIPRQRDSYLVDFLRS